MDKCANASITMKELKRGFYCRDTLMVSFSSCYPHISFNRGGVGQRVNARYLAKARDFCRYAEKTLFRQAVQEYNNSVANDFPFRTFDAVLNYTVTLNKNGCLSLFSDRYEYTGGAHGTTLREADTWDLTKGCLLPLSSFFPNCPNYCEYVIERIIRQADADMKEDPHIYFENYRELIRENFNPCNFFLTESGITVFFQQYEIAPYSSGIVGFTIKPCTTA